MKGVHDPPSPQTSFSMKYAARGRNKSTLLILHRCFTAINPNHSSLTYKSGCVGDAYPHGECRYSFSDGQTRVITGTRSSVVGTGVTALPFQYSSTQDMIAPPEMNRLAQPAAHVVACRSKSSTIVMSQSAWLTSSSLPMVSYAFHPSNCGLSEYASTPYSEMIMGFLETVWKRWKSPMGEKYRRV